jgi:hypothetical protein
VPRDVVDLSEKRLQLLHRKAKQCGVESMIPAVEATESLSPSMHTEPVKGKSERLLFVVEAFNETFGYGCGLIYARGHGRCSA